MSASFKGLLKLAALTIVLFVLLSVRYTSLSLSASFSDTPFQLAFAAVVETVLLSYFVSVSRWTGWKEWGAVFAVVYGMQYALTAMETIYVGSVLPLNTAASLLVNGAVVGALFSGAVIWAFGNKIGSVVPGADRFWMSSRAWAWRLAALGAIYLVLFVIFGALVYDPIAKILNAAALAKEQSSASTAAALVFPVEYIRAILWALLAVPAILALPLSWKKTGVVVALLMSVPVSLSLFLSNSMAVGLQIGHFFETFGEITVFGLIVTWLLGRGLKSPAQAR